MTSLNPVPSPISWPPSQFWEPHGGWSTFNLRVGTPPQVVRVLISTAGYETWVVSPLGCPPGVSPSCSNERGWLYDSDKSNTWRPLGNFSLGLELNLSPSDNATYGLDSVALGLTDNNGGPNLTSQIVAAISGYEYVLGTFGLGQQPTNLSDFNDPHPSFLTSLYDQTLIPSLSWSYTAGAHYRSKGVFGSLTLGGYDAARFIPNDVSFNLATDISRDLVVGLQGIISSESNGSIQSLLPSPHLTFIDSTVPYIYLPLDACRAFERGLGLVWNESYELYTVDEELHQSLMTRNPTLKFEIGQLETKGPTVDIELPYASLDLSYTADFGSTPVRYFPIMRAQNDSQLTLGRTFLQEAYLTTDYERANFSISQCRFEEPVGKKILPILSAKLIASTSSSPNQTYLDGKVPPAPPLNHKQIIGIVVGGLIGCIFFLTLYVKLYLLPRRRKRMETSRTTAVMSSAEDIQGALAAHPGSPQAATHRRSSSIRSITGFYGKYPAPVSELPDTSRPEMPGRHSAFELPSATPEPNIQRPTVGPGITPMSPRRRYGMYLSTNDILSSGNVVRRWMRLIDVHVSRIESLTSEESGTPTFAQSKTSYLDRSLPPTPKPESPQRFSYFAWDKVAAHQHDRLDKDPSSADLHQDPFQHRRGFF